MSGGYREYEVTVLGVDYTVTAKFCKASKGRTPRGERQIEPDEPAYFDIESAVGPDGEETSDYVLDLIQDKLMEDET